MGCGWLPHGCMLRKVEEKADTWRAPCYCSNRTTQPPLPQVELPQIVPLFLVFIPVLWVFLQVGGLLSTWNAWSDRRIKGETSLRRQSCLCTWSIIRSPQQYFTIDFDIYYIVFIKAPSVTKLFIIEFQAYNAPTPILLPVSSFIYQWPQVLSHPLAHFKIGRYIFKSG